MRSDRGQATVDYLAVLAAVALLMGAAASVLTDPTRIGRTVTRTLARAICTVGGGFCDADLRPCVTAKTERRTGWSVNVFVVRIGKDELLIREERSDGTVELTRATGVAGGIDVGVGGRLRVKGKRFGAELRADLAARHGTGKVYLAHDAAEADRIQAALTAADGALPAPVATFGSWKAERDYTASVGLGDASLAIGYAPSFEAASERDLRTGRTTVYVSHSRDFHGSLTFGDGGGGANGDLGAGERYAVVLGRDGRARELVVTDSGRYAGSMDLPEELAEVAGRLDVPVAGERLWTTETHLDLSDPATARLAAAFIDEVEHPKPYVTATGAPHRPSDELREVLRRRGTLEARTYAVASSDDGVGGQLGAGLKVGGERIDRSATSRLLAASSRGPDGEWLARGDCVTKRDRK